MKFYETSINHGFKSFFGELDDYIILGLLPSYHENPQSSLLYMLSRFVDGTNSNLSSIDFKTPRELILAYEGLKEKTKKKIMIWGVTYALLELAETASNLSFKDALVFETGGMKGRKKEMTKIELHQHLCRGLHVDQIYSEYGMCELLSQAWSKGEGVFLLSTLDESAD